MALKSIEFFAVPTYFALNESMGTGTRYQVSDPVIVFLLMICFTFGNNVYLGEAVCNLTH